MTGGWQVPGYTEVRELGTGAQGRAVLVQHEHSGRPYVIKYLTAGDTAARQRFRRESELLKTIKSPYVAQWFGHIDEGSVCAILMEAVDGVSLKEVLHANERLVPEAALLVLKGSLLGLDAAHQLGVVHRDYKPANVVVRSDGLSKLIDFGIADLTGVRDRSGTPLYMAPEQWLGDPATPSTDVYAATCVFFECIAGRPPFAATRQAHLNDPAPLQLIPAELRGLVSAGLARTPGERPARAAQFVTELEAVASDTYGSDWEARSAAVLGAAAGTLGTLFSLSLLTGSTAVTGAGTSANSVINRGFLKRIGGGRGALMIGAGATLAVTGSVLYFQKPKPKPPVESPRPVVAAFEVETATQDNVVTDPPLTVRKAQFVKVNGLKDTALLDRINQELRSPLDFAIASTKVAPCQKGKITTLSGTVRIGLRTTNLLSVSYDLALKNTCIEAGSEAWTQAVTVDLRTGKAFTNKDILTPAVLSRPSALGRSLTAQPVKYPGCPESPLTTLALDAQDTVPEDIGAASRIPLTLFFTDQGMSISRYYFGSDGCEGFTASMPYSKGLPFLRPAFTALLPT